MIGRAAQGQPWLFEQVEKFLAGEREVCQPSLEKRFSVIYSHVQKLHEHYGPVKGVWYARKHVSCYVKPLQFSSEFLARFLRCDHDQQQLEQIRDYQHALVEYTGALAA